jgi:demethylmenaquinone methyltransferase/2-methoxy-6-polyprenyl-1,4-benzoquinol methylase
MPIPGNPMQRKATLDDSFGRQSVSNQERRQRIQRVFQAVAPRYDLMNDLMSFGIHRLWKRRLAARVAASRGVAVDLAGGTGDVARLLADGSRHVVIVDPSLAMMSAGRARDGAGLRWLATVKPSACPWPTPASISSRWRSACATRRD